MLCKERVGEVLVDEEELGELVMLKEVAVELLAELEENVMGVELFE